MAYLNGQLPCLIKEEDIQGWTCMFIPIGATAQLPSGTMAEALRERGRKSWLSKRSFPFLGHRQGSVPRETQEAKGRDPSTERGTLMASTNLRGVEVDILADGRLDYPDEVLAEMDVAVASIHTEF